MENAENAVVTTNNKISLFTDGGMKSMWKLASTLAESDIVPKAFQKKAANVLIALDMANRMNASPMMVMQNLYVVYGNPGWSSKFLIATFNMCGRFSSIRYEFFGQPDTDGYGCRAYATELATGEKLFGTDVTIKMAKAEKWYDKDGSKWKTMPAQMLAYRAAAFFIRTVAPEISMGLPTIEEVTDTIEMAKDDHGAYATVDEVVAKVEAETKRAMDNLADPGPSGPAPAEAPADKPKKRPF